MGKITLQQFPQVRNGEIRLLSQGPGTLVERIALFDDGGVRLIKPRRETPAFKHGDIKQTRENNYCRSSLLHLKSM
ncbi:MAG: hypothetical protein LBR25_02335 [Erysipelotrichaceae bacterium]|nr:hypothetical protein [Erysipelotrichaceae bacterium]